jgi:hypothetical protein
MIREKRQDKCRHARDDGEPFRHRMRSTEPEYERQGNQARSNGLVQICMHCLGDESGVYASGSHDCLLALDVPFGGTAKTRCLG